MDFFEQIAREQVRAMILNNARREDLSQVFSQGEMRLLGCLHAGADGRTAGELSMLLELSTARIAAMLNNLERKGRDHPRTRRGGPPPCRCASDRAGARGGADVV